METATTMIKDAGEEKGVCKREEGTIWFRNNEKKKKMVTILTEVR